MLIAILSLTYMMIIILIHAIWISSIIKHDGKCHYHDCNRCPYDGLCPMQEDRENEKRARRTKHEDHQTERM